MWRHIGYEMFREKKERKCQKKGYGENVKPANRKENCNRVAKPV